MIKVSALHKQFGQGAGGFTAVNRISFSAEPGSFVTLLGPSGCGKTTTLRLLAGLERPTGGSIYIDGECMASAEARSFIPTHRRPIGMVFQSYAIWPHMTVAGNVAFPLRVRRPRVPRAEVARRVDEALSLVGLADLGSRMSTELSGGQQQRVALARALIRQPKVLLLDEPLSNLDAELRERMRDEIREVQQRLGITTVFVTHDQAEALAMSDQVIVMDGGSIVETGLPQEIYNFPRRTFTAKFLGVSNNFTGTVSEADGDTATITTAHGPLTARTAAPLVAGREVRVAMRPDAFTIHRREPGPDAWRGTVRFATYHGDSWLYHVDTGDQTIKIRATKEKIGLGHGDAIYLTPEPGAAIITHDSTTDAAADTIGDGDAGGTGSPPADTPAAPKSTRRRGYAIRPKR
jgi:iron(III) transport system ATP-binding protein